MKRLLTLGFLMGILGLVVPPPLWGQTIVFEKVKARIAKDERSWMMMINMIEHDVDLVFDDSTRQLIVRRGPKPLTVAYDMVEMLTFEATTTWTIERGLYAIRPVGRVPGPGVPSVAANDYFLYFEYRTPDGIRQRYLLKIDKDSSAEVLEKAKNIFGGRIKVPEFPESARKVDRKTLKDVGSKHSLKIDRRNHPLPDLRPNQALVVVVVQFSDLMHSGLFPSAFQAKLHANDRVIAVNYAGTYSFAYLDPGEYLLAAQSGSTDAEGFRITLEAGKDYYFLIQHIGGEDVSFARHSKELVMYELNGANYSVWKRK